MDFFLWLAIAMLAVFGIYLITEDWPFLKRSRRIAVGTVFDHQRTQDDDSVFYKARVRFKADNGGDVEITDVVGLPKPSPQAGSKVTVVYPDGLPEKARIQRLWLRPVLYAFVLGTTALLLAKRFG